MHRTFLPYAAGLLQAYVMRHAPEPWRYTFLRPVFERQPMEQAMQKLGLAQVLGFSCYIWNFNYSLELARRIKAQRPDTLIIFGGPHVPDRAEAFLRQQPVVDVAVHGEGERIFLELLESYSAHGGYRAARESFATVPGISYIDSDGSFVNHARPPRIADLDSIPSPYLVNVFEPMLKEFPGDTFLAMWETNRGCPFQCSFCDWGSAIAGKVHKFSMERLLAEAEWFGRHDINTIWCCDANFGMLKRDLELTEKMIATKKQHGAPKVFYTQSAKNATERVYQIQKLICHAGMNQALTLSLQSVTPEVLKNIKRENISLDTYRELQNRFRDESVPTYTDILIGLPGETFESFVRCVERVIDEGQHNFIRFYMLGMLPNAEVSEPAYRAEHGIESVAVHHAYPMGTTGEDWPEVQEIAIATKTMPRPDWVRARSYAWWAEFTHLKRKLLQVPIVLLRRAGIPYGDTFQFFLEGDLPPTVLWEQIRGFIRQKSESVQKGGPEVCPVKTPTGEVWVTVEEYLITGLSQSQAWPLFFEEASRIFEALQRKTGIFLPPGVMQEALMLQANLDKGLLTEEPFEQHLSSNLWEVYQAQLRSETLDFEPRDQVVYRDWTGLPYHTLKYRGERVPEGLPGLPASV